MFSLLWSVTARAFDDDVEHHPDIVDLCKKWFRKEDLTDPCFKLALIPTQVRMRSFLICSRKRVSSHWLCLKICKVWLPLSQAKLNFGTDKATGRPTQYPLISVENVFVFPGKRHFVIIFLSSAHVIRRTSSSFAVWNWVSPLHCSFLHKNCSTSTQKADPLQNVFQESQNFYGKPSTTSAFSFLELENRFYFRILCFKTK